MSSRTVLTVLSVTVGLFFVFIGFLKFSTIISEDLYKDARKAFIKTAKALSVIGVDVKPQFYRRLVCCNEILSGLVLAFVPGVLKQAANVCLLLQCVVHIVGVYFADETLKDGATSVVFALMLTCRLVLFVQITQHERREAAEKQKQLDEQGDADDVTAELSESAITKELLRKLKEKEALLEAAQQKQQQLKEAASAGKKTS